MSDEQHTIDVQLTLLDGYKFEVDFGEMGQLFTDEPPPLGKGHGPNPGKLLIASVANCLAASLMFAIRKFKEDPGKVSANVRGDMQRIDGRWRITHIQVDLKLGKTAAEMPHLQRALAQFEDFCIVTQSVRSGIDVTVNVTDKQNQPLMLKP
ncbi:OsmC family protein [Bowmanella sp. JS7-9]|uniref:OsmC family protein n=1 Tax=Pseudobowmanella zhangzhouensis TaxID=1537679 RepID=A0ABW1XQG9_9ALTE|nr:OsmC family protein [Bowmanella sp. JS7-9]TBX23716.1 hypothetical protein TK45_06370 [Bowmanella sp. JS7-9]